MPIFPTSLRAGLACAAALFVVAGCGGAGLFEASRVRLVNASTDFATLDLYESSDRVSRDVARNAAGGYEELESGGYTFDVVAGGVVAASVDGEVDDDASYTVVAYSDGGTLNALLLSDEEDEPDSGFARIRILNAAAADAGNLDVYLFGAACSTLAASSVPPVAAGVSGLQSGFSQVTASGSGTSYHLCVTAAGDKADVRLEVADYALESRQVVTLVLTRGTGGVLVDALAVEQRGDATAYANGQTRVRVAVGTSAGALASVTAGGVSLSTGLAPGGVNSYQRVDATATTADVIVGTASAVPVSIALAPGGDATLLVTGTPAAPVVTVIPDDNRVSNSTARPVKLRLVNGMPGTGSLQLAKDFDPIGAGAPPLGTSGYAQVESSAAQARLEVSGYCLSDDVTLAAGKIYTVFLLGTPPTTAGPCTVRADR